jgi:hypothetical protein
VIVVTAASDGTWGNFVQLDVDCNTINPDSLFNLRVTQLIPRQARRSGDLHDARGRD